jgi:predicted AAA+ superfamily ATPase
LDTFHVCGLVGARNQLWLFEQTDESVDEALLCVGDGKHSALLALFFVKGHQLIGVFKLEIVALPVAVLPLHQISETFRVHVDDTRYVDPSCRLL